MRQSKKLYAALHGCTVCALNNQTSVYSIQLKFCDKVQLYCIHSNARLKSYLLPLSLVQHTEEEWQSERCMAAYMQVIKSKLMSARNLFIGHIAGRGIHYA